MKAIFSIVLILIIIGCTPNNQTAESCTNNVDSLLPSFFVPEGDGILRSSSYLGGRDAQEFEILSSDKDVATLTQHYLDQLIKKKLTIVTSEISSHIAAIDFETYDSCNTIVKGTVIISKSTTTANPFIVVRVFK